MIQTRINHADISWEEFPILAFNPDLNVIIIALENGDYLKGTVVSSDNPEHPIGEYYEYWEKSQFCPFEDEVISKHKEHYQEIIDNTKVEKDTVFLCDRVDLFKIK